MTCTFTVNTHQYTVHDPDSTSYWSCCKTSKHRQDEVLQNCLGGKPLLQGGLNCETKIKWNRERWGGRTRQKSICKGMCAGNPDQRAGLGSLRSNRHHRAFNDKFCHPPCNLVYKNGWGLFSFFPCQWDMQTFSQRRSSQKKRRGKKRQWECKSSYGDSCPA